MFRVGRSEYVREEWSEFLRVFIITSIKNGWRNSWAARKLSQ